MTQFGFRAVSEQFSPSELLDQATLVERKGFDFVTASDHFHPWFHTGAHSPFSWVLIASAAAATRKLRLGTGVTSPVFRYNPAIIAQAFATLDSIYPSRIFLTLGTGEGMNEIPVGYRWPGFEERAERLEEALVIIRRLWNESFVDFRGKHFQLNGANLYTKPKGKIPIFIASRGRKTARFAGRYGDGFYTHTAAKEKLNDLMEAFKLGLKESADMQGSKDAMIELLLSYSRDHVAASKAIERWRSTAVPKRISVETHDPRSLEELGSKIDLRKLEEKWLICGSVDEIIERVEEHIGMGFNHIEFHLADPGDKAVIDLIGKRVLPYFRDER